MATSRLPKKNSPKFELPQDECFTVTITNWAKHNPRKDVKRPTWFALDNHMVEDDDFFDFNHGEFKAVIFIFSVASRKQCDTIEVSTRRALRMCNISAEDLKSAIQKLEAKRIVTVDVTDTSHARDADVTDTSHARDATYIQTDIQTDTPAVTDVTPVIPALCGDSSFSQLALKLNPSEPMQESWIKLFPIEFIWREAIKMNAWLADNPKKNPVPGKGGGKFINNWLTKGFDQYRKQIPTNKPGQGQTYSLTDLYSE